MERSVFAKDSMSIDQSAVLADYGATKRQVARLVRAVRQLLETRPGADPERCQALLSRLAEDRFNLAVVGQFKRGKSTLMNALIGRDLLPTGFLPLTSVVTTLCYGPRERAVLRRKGWVLQPEIPMDDLAMYVSERGNPGNEKGILEVRVELPEKILRQGLSLCDTPGIGSARRENTETTYAFLPEADAVILVTSVDSPLSEAELEFLRDIRQHVRKVFVVVNKVDLLAATEREQVLDYVRTGLQQVMGGADLRLYPLSARQGLEAKLHANGDGWYQSGMADFEASLMAFLTQDKGQTFLIAILDRALDLASSEKGMLGDPAQPVADTALSADALCRSIKALRAALLENAHVDQRLLETGEAPVDLQVLSREMEISRQASQGRQLLSRVGSCPICAVESQAAFDFFAHWQYVLSTSPDARAAFAAVHGFCHVHTWQFQQIASPQGVAEGYEPLVKLLAATLRDLANDAPLREAARLREMLQEPQGCPACEVMRTAAQARLDGLLAALEDDNGQGHQEGAAGGLCLPHLQMVLSQGLSADSAYRLLNEQSERLYELSEDMQSYVLKRSARRRELIHADEENAWLRALVKLVGERTARYHWER